MSLGPVAASPAQTDLAQYVDQPHDFVSPSGYDYNNIQGVRGNPHVTQEFIDKVEAIAQRIGTKPEYLMTVMSFESGQTFSPDVVSGGGSGATGLIQFLPSTAEGLGTSVYALSQMSSVEQLDYVEKYFGSYAGSGKLGTLEGLYTTVLAGHPVADPGETLFDTGDGAAYSQNAGLDANNDGRITSGEATSRVRQQAGAELPPPDGPAPNPGPNPTPDPEPNPTPDPGPGTEGGTYTVQDGDSLWGIANARNTDWQTLARLNGLNNPDMIYPGQVIKMPGSGDAPSATGTHTVREGETLSTIADTFDINWQDLAQLNGLDNPDLIYPGQVLKVPGGGDPAPGPEPAPEPGPTPEPGPAPAPGPGGANTDRNAFYLAQPDGWSCGPTSLTMALAAWGVRPASMETRNEAVGLIGQNWGEGVPGNASLIAQGARNAGLQASFNPDGSAGAVRAALEAGHTVVLNGGLPGGGGHFIYVAGIDGNGNFIIGDPARPGITTMTAGELEAFSYANPGEHPNGFAEIWK